VKLNILLFLFALLTACAPAPAAALAPAMADARFRDLTGAWIIGTDTDYRVGILPFPAEVTLADKNAVVVALAFEGTDLPMKVSDMQTATLVSTVGQVYPAGLVMEMGCWSGVMVITSAAWEHAARRRLCGDGTENPGVPGMNGIVIVFYIDDDFTQATGISFHLPQPNR
jgi:hypothetical protein